MFDHADDPFLTIEEAATVLRMAKRTLDNHRSKNTGPTFRRHGGRIVYRHSDLFAWSEQRAARTTRSDKNQTPSSVSHQCDGGRSSSTVMAKGDRAVTALECQPEYSHRPLRDEFGQASKGELGGHPSP